MTITPSRMLTRLDADIAAATDPVAADCLRAERASYLARQGHLAEAAEALEAIRLRHQSRPNAAVSAWVSLAEGILIHFTDMSPRARDKVLRAYALSTAAGLRPIQANCAAWMAHIEYSRLDVQSIFEYARVALDLVDRNCRSAISRVCLTVAQAFHLAGKLEMAQPWYGRARNIAITDGDDALIAALSHNMAWLHFSDLRTAYLTKNDSPSALRSALLGSSSYDALAELIGDRSLPELSPILRAQVLSISGEAEAARKVYEKFLVDRVHPTLARFSANLTSDFAWCCVRTGDLRRGQELAELAEISIDEFTQIDELATTYSQLKMVYGALDNPTEERRFSVLARQAWLRHQFLQDRIVLLMGSLKLPVGED